MNVIGALLAPLALAGAIADGDRLPVVVGGGRTLGCDATPGMD